MSLLPLNSDLCACFRQQLIGVIVCTENYILCYSSSVQLFVHFLLKEMETEKHCEWILSDVTDINSYTSKWHCIPKSTAER